MFYLGLFRQNLARLLRRDHALVLPAAADVDHQGDRKADQPSDQSGPKAAHSR